MKNLLAGLAALSVLTASSLQLGADNCRPHRPWYIGAGVNQNGVFSDRNDSENTIDNINEDHKPAWGAHLFLGYRFTNWFALELGYTYFGHTAFNEQLTIDQLTILAGEFCERSSWAIPLRGKISYCVARNFDVFALLGMNYYNIFAKLNSTLAFQDIVGPERRSGVSIMYGLGAQYYVAEAWSVRAAVNRYALSTSIDNYRTSIELSVLYGF